MRVFLTCILLKSTFALFGQESFPCANAGYPYLKQLIGHWDVKTRDRTSPGIYHDNSGKAIITPGIEGCGIVISYRGTYKNKAYAREVSLIGLDSSQFQMVALDSEHGSFSFLEGSLEDDQLVLYWYRNKQVRRLISKYVMTFLDDDQFEFSSFLSTDHGENWALTHQRIYSRGNP